MFGTALLVLGALTIVYYDDTINRVIYEVGPRSTATTVREWRGPRSIATTVRQWRDPSGIATTVRQWRVPWGTATTMAGARSP